MGGGQPYLYSPPASFNQYDPYNSFNPKAASQASLTAARAGPRPKKDGPLIEFNKHPDSYVIAQEGKTDFVRMHESTPKRVRMGKRFQMGMRAVQIAVALGILVLVICLQGMKDTEAWILRIAVSFIVVVWDIKF